MGSPNKTPPGSDAGPRSTIARPSRPNGDRKRSLADGIKRTIEQLEKDAPPDEMDASFDEEDATEQDMPAYETDQGSEYMELDSYSPENRAQDEETYEDLCRESMAPVVEVPSTPETHALTPSRARGSTLTPTPTQAPAPEMSSLTASSPTEGSSSPDSSLRASMHATSVPKARARKELPPAQKKGGKISASFLDASKEALGQLEQRAKLCAGFLRRVDEAAADYRAKTQDTAIHHYLDSLVAIIGDAGRVLMLGQDTAPRPAKPSASRQATKPAAPSYAQAARAAPAPGTEAPLPPKPGKTKDTRLFVRLSESSVFRKMSPHEIRRRVDEVLPEGKRISDIQYTPTGIAVVPMPAQDISIHSKDIARALGAVSAEGAERPSRTWGAADQAWLAIE